MLRETVLYERLAGERVRCHVCQWRCVIAPGAWGHCRTRVNRDGVLQSVIYGVVSSAAADPVEKKPVFHYRPGSQVFSLGSLGCNFRCSFCQNWQIAYADGSSGEPQDAYLSAERAVKMALEQGCTGMAWTYNEPSIWLEYTLDCARLAKQAGLYTVYVTNGYASEEALDLIGPYLDVYRVDCKSYSPGFYRDLIGVEGPEGVRRVAERARRRWSMHVEVVTNLVPGHNDEPEELRRLARWIRDALGPETPWHITRFFPHARLSHLPATPLSTLTMAQQLAKSEGLAFVYLGNVPPGEGENTYCPTGGELVVARSGYRTRLVAVRPDGKCVAHGTDLNLRL